jgi:hypothetical protein
VPWYVLGAGVFGLVVIAAVSYMIPRIGVAAATTTIVAGQILIGTVLDHFGLLGAAARPMEPAYSGWEWCCSGLAGSKWGFNISRAACRLQKRHSGTKQHRPGEPGEVTYNEVNLVVSLPPMLLPRGACLSSSRACEDGQAAEVTLGLSEASHTAPTGMRSCYDIRGTQLWEKHRDEELLCEARFHLRQAVCQTADKC